MSAIIGVLTIDSSRILSYRRPWSPMCPMGLVLPTMDSSRLHAARMCSGSEGCRVCASLLPGWRWAPPSLSEPEPALRPQRFSTRPEESLEPPRFVGAGSWSSSALDTHEIRRFATFHPMTARWHAGCEGDLATGETPDDRVRGRSRENQGTAPNGQRQGNRPRTRSSGANVISARRKARAQLRGEPPGPAGHVRSALVDSR